MASHTLTLGQNIQTAVTAGAAGDTYNFAAGIYYGQTWNPKNGDFYIGAASGGTILSGASLVTSWTNVSGNWQRATQGTTDLGGAANFPSPAALWRGTATISGTTLTIVSTISGTFGNGGGNGASLYGNGVTAGTTVTSGAGTTWTISPTQTISSTTNMIVCAQQGENSGNGGAPSDPLVYMGEELFVDNVRYTRIQAAAVPVAPGANQWFYDFSNSSINITLASPGSHTIEYTQVTGGMNNNGSINATFSNLTVEKQGGFYIGAIATGLNAGVPESTGSLNLYNVTSRFNKSFGVNCYNNGTLTIVGGHFNDNGENGIVGSPYRALVTGAELARNNAALGYSARYQAGGLKFTGASDTEVYGCSVHGNGGPGIWHDISSVRNLIGYNTCVSNTGPGIMEEISMYARIFGNTISGSGLEPGQIDAGIYISNSNNVEVDGNTVTVGLGHTGRVEGGIDVYNGVRGSTGTNAVAAITGWIAGSTLTVTAVTGTIQDEMRLVSIQLCPGTFIQCQLTGTTGSTGTYQLSLTQPNIASSGAPIAMTAFDETNDVLYEARNLSIHHNTIVYLDATGATDSIAVDQAIVGGSNNYKDFNTYYTPNGSGTFWYRGTDAAVNTSYTWSAYQAAGFEPNGVNIVGLPPAQSPLVTAGVLPSRP